MRDTVMVEKNTQGLAIRIFRGSHTAFVPGMIIDTMDYRQAVGEVRHALFVRSGGFCELCASPILEATAHMHEQVHRGKGGEISLANSVFICPTCHRHAHQDRNPRFSTSKSTKAGETVCRHLANPFDCRICTGRAEKA